MTQKRILLQGIAAPAAKAKSRKSPRLAKPLPIVVPRVKGEVGRLETVDSREKRVLIVQLSRLFLIGRSENCDYVATGPAVSKLHCRLYALETDTGEKIVGLEDTSSNGTMHNNRRLWKQSVILNEGDIVEIGGQVFKYHHSSKPGQIINSTPGARICQQKIGNYIVFDRLLGSGAFCVVRLALNTKSLKQVACKVLKRSTTSTANIGDLQREVVILKGLKHPNINRIEDIVVDNLSVNIFLQLVSGGDLFGYLLKNTKLSAAETKFIMYQLFLATDYLHALGNVAHRDIKLENVLLEGPGPFPRVLLADFGQACLSEGRLTSLSGTPIYMAPEALSAKSRHKGYDGAPADCWALGCILSTLLNGYHPFETHLEESQIESVPESLFGESAMGMIEQDEKITCYNILRGFLHLSSDTYGSFDNEVRDLIQLLLTVEPKKRATARQALDHAWIRSSHKELLELYSAIVLNRM